MTPTIDQRLADALERLSNARRAAMRGSAAGFGMSPLQLDLLLLLRRAPPPDPRVGALARELGIASPTVTDAVSALVRKGLLSESTDPGDRRRKNLRLTPAGSRVVAEFAAAAPIDVALGPLDAAAKAAALDVALELIAALYRAGVITVDRSCKTCRFYERADAGDRCALLERPLTAATLRVNCPEHQPAAA